MNRAPVSRRPATSRIKTMDENATVGPSTHHRKPSGSNMPVAKKPSLGPSAGGKAAVPTRRGAFADVSNKTKEEALALAGKAAGKDGASKPAATTTRSRSGTVTTSASNPVISVSAAATAASARPRAPLTKTTSSSAVVESAMPALRQAVSVKPPIIQLDDAPLAEDDTSYPDEQQQLPLDDVPMGEAIAHDQISRGVFDEGEGFYSEDELDEDDPEDWTRMTLEEMEENVLVLDKIRETFEDDVDLFDTTMVAEYSDEIFAYMEELEINTMANPRYMDAQTEIEWGMRSTLVDWLLQVHLRYHLLPETLWIAVNIVDRFLSQRVVSLVKLQLVGVTAMFIAAKYEEILAPSVDEFVYMTENGYTKDEILKGERIVLQTLDFNISSYCSPYSWVRRISKADDYDIQTRTLSKFLIEATLLDHRFLRAKPSLIAAIGMFLANRMLGKDWNESFVFYSTFTENQLIPGAELLMEQLAAPEFEGQYVYKKYSHRRFLKASQFAREWARTHLGGGAAP